MNTYFVVAHWRRMSTIEEESFCIEAKDANTAFDLAKGELLAQAELNAKWTIIKFTKVEQSNETKI